jgi:DNA-binding transcriptional ArsR family regulator
LNLDRVIHSPARLAIMTQLMAVEEADATWLHQQTELSWGNLASHIAKLEDAGYVQVDKQFVGKKPQTMYSLTKNGIKAYKSYRTALLKILNE